MWPELNVFLYKHLLTHDLVDYNSWIESDKGIRLAETLSKDTVLAEGRRFLDSCLNS